MTDLPTFKPLAHAHCLAVVKERIVDLEANILDTQRSSQSDTKSSAGDKHETGRAMAQLEVEKQQVSLGNLIAMRDVLARLDPTLPHKRVHEGALVRTDRGLFYIAVGLGRLVVDGQEVLVMSPQAPLAEALQRTPIGGTARFNGVAHVVVDVC
ncbi:MAG: 3-oxoacyl-ACP synthase [Flavobacteriales bacterium]|nr:3-oxoacyl-ACP synthase [Flavobacteriales bacterium]